MENLFHFFVFTVTVVYNKKESTASLTVMQKNIGKRDAKTNPHLSLLM
jgi:hypothetical protein